MKYYATAKEKTDVAFGPAPGIYAKVGTIGVGEKVEVIGKDGDFYHIIYKTSSSDKAGYVHKDKLQSTSILPQQAEFSGGMIYIVKYDNTEVYYGPSSSQFQKAGTLSKNETVIVYTQPSSSFIFVEYGSPSGRKRGYIKSTSAASMYGQLGKTKEETQVFTGPAISYVRADTLNSATYLVVLGHGRDTLSDWTFIEYAAGSNQKRGYVQANKILTIGTGSIPCSVKNATSTAHMRNNEKVYGGPTEKYAQVGSVDAGEAIQVLAEDPLQIKTYRQIEYNTSSGKKRGYVNSSAIGPIIDLPHIMNESTPVYAGPIWNSYAIIGSVSVDERVRCVEKEGDSFLIEYSTSTKLKQGYVPKNKTKNFTSIENTLPEYSPYGFLDIVYDGSYDVYAGPDDLNYAPIGSVSPHESVTVLGGKTSTFTRIEFSTPEKTKRGYLKSKFLQGAHNGILAYSSATKSLPVYSAPDVLKNLEIGSVDAHEYFIALDFLNKNSPINPAEELYDTEWYYIEYNTSSGRKRGFVDASYVHLLTAPGEVSSLMDERRGVGTYRLLQDTTVRLGPAESYPFVTDNSKNPVTIPNGTIVNKFASRPFEELFANIEFGLDPKSTQICRGYIPNPILQKETISIPAPQLTVTEKDECAFNYGSTYKGHDLTYYKIGHGSKALLVVFAIHGYEDGWAADGIELVKIANYLIETMVAKKSQTWSEKWTLYIIPAANPDGIVNGYTHCGPGRSNVENAIDMNRCFPTRFTAYYTRRNRTGSKPLIPTEANCLNTLIENINTDTATTAFYLLDIHGWMNMYQGDAVLGSKFMDVFQTGNFSGNKFGALPNLFSGGLLYTHARSAAKAKYSALIELPPAKNSYEIQSRGYSAAVTSAIETIIQEV